MCLGGLDANRVGWRARLQTRRALHPPLAYPTPSPPIGRADSAEELPSPGSTQLAEQPLLDQGVEPFEHLGILELFQG